MGRIASSWSAPVCAALLLFMGGCGPGTAPLIIKFTQFYSGAVDGIWLWRLESPGKYTRACILPITKPLFLDGFEVVAYGQVCTDGTGRKAPFVAAVVRTPTDPATVTVTLRYQTGARQVATYKASAYNSYGESVLSSASVRF